jgi:hypothetical protein
MIKTLSKLFILIVVLASAGCSRGEGGAAGYGAGGGQSLREGSTSPLHSAIAQDQTYQRFLGLNILDYPPPVDDAKFDPYGEARWELDATDFVQTMKGAFTGIMELQAVYEPEVQALEGLALIDQVRETVYGGQPVQVGWVYGNNGNLDFVEYNGVPVTLITGDPALLYLAFQEDFDSSNWTLETSQLKPFYTPANTVLVLNADTIRSAPLRVVNATGQLTAVIVPDGVGVESATAGSGFDQALVAKDRWVFALPDVIAGYYVGLSGRNRSIVPID